MITNILAPVLRAVGAVGADQSDFRAVLVATQLAGIAVIRYVARFDQFSTTDIDINITARSSTYRQSSAAEGSLEHLMAEAGAQMWKPRQEFGVFTGCERGEGA